MSDLRKLLASALNSGSLVDDPLVETALDRVLAFAYADKLGGALWRLKWANDHRAYQPALHLLVRKVRKKHEALSMVQKVARCCLNEWLDELCRPCQGRGYMVVEGTPHASHVCVKCNGTRMRRPSDHSRMRDIGLPVDAYQKWETSFARMHAAITAADQRAWFEIAAKLEHGGIKNNLASVRGSGNINESTRLAHTVVAEQSVATHKKTGEDQRVGAERVGAESPQLPPSNCDARPARASALAEVA